MPHVALALLLSLSAPAPTPKTPALTPASVTMTWMGVECETHFHQCGTFACLWHGEWWEGRWSQKAGSVTVEEWKSGPRPASPLRWSVSLTSGSAGVMRGTPWSVRPLGGPVK